MVTIVLVPTPTSPLSLSLGGSEPVEFPRFDSSTPNTVTVLAVLPHGAVVDISYGYPISFNRAMECALAIHAPQEWRSLE
jgi:hypothetical protein